MPRAWLFRQEYFLRSSPASRWSQVFCSTCQRAVWVNVRARSQVGSFRAVSSQVAWPNSISWPRWMLAGRIIACLRLLVGILLFFAAGFENELALFGSTILVGTRIGITMPSSNVGTYRDGWIRGYRASGTDVRCVIFGSAQCLLGRFPRKRPALTGGFLNSASTVTDFTVILSRCTC